MIAEIGHYALVLAFFVAVAQVACSGSSRAGLPSQPVFEYRIA